VNANTHHGLFTEDTGYLIVDAIGHDLRNIRPYARMKFAVFAWVSAAACLVIVCGQPTTEEDDSPDVDLANVAKQTTLTGVAKVLDEVKTAVANLNQRNPQLNLNMNPIVLLRGKTELNTYLLAYYGEKLF